MSEPVSALNGVSADGFARIRETGPLGMISLRCDLSDPLLPDLIKALTGTAVPACGGSRWRIQKPRAGCRLTKFW